MEDVAEEMHTINIINVQPLEFCPEIDVIDIYSGQQNRDALLENEETVENWHFLKDSRDTLQHVDIFLLYLRYKFILYLSQYHLTLYGLAVSEDKRGLAEWKLSID